jgi:coenzyme F420-0:L-glutamate ligase/coenzyme F420-1:gamma-L-glutamate ligase
MISIHPLEGLGEIETGADLAPLLRDALNGQGLSPPEPGDVLVVTQKIVSKAEGRWRDLRTVTPGTDAEKLAATTRKEPRFVQAVLDESTEVVRAAPHVLITRHRNGFVMANAGIDRSNLGERPADMVLLLPEDGDLAATSLRERLGLPIVISDSFGRPWRLGVTAVAIGASGLPALMDRRGALDRNGRPLEVTQIALGDLLASAAALAMGEADEGIPAALVRGCSWTGEEAPAATLLRPPGEDLFR